MVAPDGTVNPAIGGWSEALEELHRRIAYREVSLCSHGFDHLKIETLTR
jgi:hypothetical protein